MKSLFISFLFLCCNPLLINKETDNISPHPLLRFSDIGQNFVEMSAEEVDGLKQTLYQYSWASAMVKNQKIRLTLEQESSGEPITLRILMNGVTYPLADILGMNNRILPRASYTVSLFKNFLYSRKAYLRLEQGQNYVELDFHQNIVLFHFADFSVKFFGSQQDA